MSQWLVVLLLIVIVVILLVALWWWWTHRQTMAPTSRTGAASSIAPAAEVGSGPYGPGSAAPLAGGAAPAGFSVKGNADSMLYHSPDSPYYGRTVAEVWFRTEADAQKAGFKRWDQKDA